MEFGDSLRAYQGVCGVGCQIRYQARSAQVFFVLDSGVLGVIVLGQVVEEIGSGLVAREGEGGGCKVV